MGLAYALELELTEVWKQLEQDKAWFGLLRLIQSEWSGIAEGGTSWIPYAIVFIVTVLLIVVSLLRINKTYLNKGIK